MTNLIEQLKKEAREKYEHMIMDVKRINALVDHIHEQTVRECMNVMPSVEDIVLPDNHTMNGKTIHDWEGQSLFHEGQKSMLHRTLTRLEALLNPGV